MLESGAGTADEREAIVVIGLGYVGVPLADAFAQAGEQVIGFDIDAAKVAALNDTGHCYLGESAASEFAGLHRSKNFTATDDAAELGGAKAVLICVPTPVNEGTNVPDLIALVAATRTVAAHIKPQTLVIVESTSFPGTTREVVLPLVQHITGRLAYSPEREDPGRAVKTASIPKLVGGLSAEITRAAAALYSLAFDSVVSVDTPEIAEAAKMLENSFRAVNLAFINEFSSSLEKLGVDPLAVIDAAATKPYGFMPFYPGPGVGGHCIPVDPRYILWRVQESGDSMPFLQAAMDLIDERPGFVANGAIKELAERRISSGRVVLVGVAYKANVADVRNAPALEVAATFTAAGFDVEFIDPNVDSWQFELNGGTEHRIAISLGDLQPTDVVILLVNHTSMDLASVVDQVDQVFDFCGALRASP